MKIRRKCEKASLGGYFLLKWLRTDCSLWNSDYSCSEEPRTLSKGSSWRQKAWPQSDPYIPKPEADISRVRRRKKHHMTRHRHSRFSLCPRQMKDWLTFAFLIIFFFCFCFGKNIQKKKPRRTNMEMWGKHSSKSTEAPFFKGDTQQLSPC